MDRNVETPPEAGERRRMQRALRESEARLRTVLTSVPTVLFALDRDGVFTFSEGRALEVLGLRPGEVVGRSVYEIYGAIPQVLDDVRRALDGEDVTSMVEVRGHVFETRYSALRDDEGAVTGAVGAALDVTERRAAEEALQARHRQAARFQAALLELARADEEELDAALRRIVRGDAAVMEAERVSAWFFSPDGEELVCRTLYTRADGFHEGGPTLRAAELPEYFATLRERRVIAAGDAVHDPATHEFAEAYLVPLGIAAMLDVPVWRNGRMVGVVCQGHLGGAREWTLEEQEFATSVADMVSLALESAERKRAEAAARGSEARKAAVVEAALDCIVTMDVTGRIMEFNPSAERVFGCPAAEAVGRMLDDLIIPPRLRRRHRRGVARHLTSGRILGRRIETWAVRADGSEFPVELTITRIPTGGDPLFTGFLRDITGRRRAEEALRSAEREAQRMAERMRAVAGAAAGVIGARSREALRDVLEEACRRVLPFDAFFIMAYDAEADAFVGFGGNDAGVYSPPNVVPAAGTPAERAVRERRSVLALHADDPAHRGAELT
ncbi:MAG: PAS domain S-box protein, partial [Gemmatimonadetes bacterium]|nr:PAS domain S-box protein [Gemmatimonadota bacterium]